MGEPLASLGRPNVTCNECVRRVEGDRAIDSFNTIGTCALAYER